MEFDNLYCDVIAKRWEEFSGRNVERIAVEAFTAVCRLGHRNGRLKQAEITNTFRSAVVFDQAAMQSQRMIQVQKQRRSQVGCVQRTN